MNGEDPPERPEYISSIINGLERYNPEAVGTLESYLQEQCEQKYCDCNANRTLLKLYVCCPLCAPSMQSLFHSSCVFMMNISSTFPIT
jgi:hypothetical protein